MKTFVLDLEMQKLNSKIEMQKLKSGSDCLPDAHQRTECAVYRSLIALSGCARICFFSCIVRMAKPG